MLPRSIPRPDTPLPRSAADRLRSDRPGPQAFLRSAMPALDRAFGLEHIAAVPDDIADLIGRLQAGPLGHPGAGQASISERTSILERAAVLEPAEAVS